MIFCFVFIQSVIGQVEGQALPIEMIHALQGDVSTAINGTDIVSNRDIARPHDSDASNFIASSTFSQLAVPPEDTEMKMEEEEGLEDLETGNKGLERQEETSNSSPSDNVAGDKMPVSDDCNVAAQLVDSKKMPCSAVSTFTYLH